MSLSAAPQTISIRPQRSLGLIPLTVVVEEKHTDTLEITDHPVELGTAISDHAFKKPAEVTLKAGWSNSDLNAGGNPLYVAEVYDKLLGLQERREPFDLVTGKRAYRNMLLSSLAVTTDEKSEEILMVTATCREVIIVETMVTNVPPRRVHRKPGRTCGVEDRGTRSPRTQASA